VSDLLQETLAAEDRRVRELVMAAMDALWALAAAAEGNCPTLAMRRASGPCSRCEWNDGESVTP
jgi:hypothetical protein